MTDMTPLDRAHAAMAAQDDVTTRLQFYDCLADTEVLLLLENEPVGDKISPRVFALEAGKFAFIFDTDDRLSDFARGVATSPAPDPAPYIAMSGRAVANLFAGQGIGLALNPGVVATPFLLPADAVNWFAETLNQTTQPETEHPTAISPPVNFPKAILRRLAAKLTLSAGLADAAYLVRASYASGTDAYLLGIVDAEPGVQRALTQAVQGALVFSGDADGHIDVAYFTARDPIFRTLAQQGIKFDMLRAPEPRTKSAPPPPGSDPGKPPRLR